MKWSSNNDSIATVSGKGKGNTKGIGRTIIIGMIESKKYSCKIEVGSNNTSDKLNEIDNFAIGTLWNDGFGKVDSYIKPGSGYLGNDFAINNTIREISVAIAQMSAYNKYILGLKGNEYESLKSV